MDKSDFLNKYLPLFSIHFHDNVFSKDNSIKVIEQKLPFKELLEFYILRTVKNGLPDTRGIEERENDLNSKLITLYEARQNPKKWGLESKGRIIPSLKDIRPIPVAVDPDSGNCLILDSNHLLTNLNCPSDTVIPLALIVGPNLEALGPDFIILSRQ